MAWTAWTIGDGGVDTGKLSLRVRDGGRGSRFKTSTHRTLQTLASWIREQKEDSPEVPSLPEIQNVLVDLGDKEKAFNGSKQWIGSFEVNGSYATHICMHSCKVFHFHYRFAWCLTSSTKYPASWCT